MPEFIVIVGTGRTPIGGFQGDFSSLSAHDLGGAAIKAAVERAGIAPDTVGEVLFGNCLMAGQGQAPARQAAYKGGLPDSAGAVTLSKMCGSAMKAAMLAHDLLLAGTHVIQEFDSPAGHFFRVQVGREPTLQAAQRLAAQLAAQGGFRTFVVRFDAAH